MQHPETHLALHHARAADLHAQAEAHRLVVRAGQPHDIRSRLGWTLVELGLRLATPRRTALAH
ncbi:MULTISPECIES: hypothetical protein [Streptomyces]|uniref:hypothetical protein n=1 Tax=Streptomyces TaxID=1883 RepID=UPI0004CB97A2|nr:MULTISPECIES: hypothetical protein [unclassified Streptomyces]SEC57385.1 hypothetical protein SAMN05216482_3805 [Streptomyces sp. PAN_FS17]SED22736.1 hypothetical protein SAMN05428938_4295 [Streptomyces sp. KS_5]